MNDYMQLAAAVIPVLLLIWRGVVLTRREVHALHVAQKPPVGGLELAPPPPAPDDILIGTTCDTKTKTFTGVYVDAVSDAVHARVQEAFASSPNAAKFITLNEEQVKVTKVPCIMESAAERIRAVVALFPDAKVRYSISAKERLGEPDEMALLRRSVETLGKDLAAVKTERDVLSKSHLDACRRLDDAKADVERLTKLHDIERGERERAEKERDDEAALRKSWQGSFLTMQKERDELQALYAKADDKVDALVENVGKYQESLLAATKERDELRDIANRQAEELQGYDARHGEVVTDLAAVKKERDEAVAHATAHFEEIQRVSRREAQRVHAIMKARDLLHEELRAVPA